ncbi:hypothetical protein AAE478_003272 [Parahypoxylon ruwenzoriense]
MDRKPQQPSKVIHLTITPTFYHRPGPKSQQIRLGRDRAIPEVICRIDRVDAAVASDRNEVDAETKVLAGIVSDLVVGFDAEIWGAGLDCLPEFEEYLRRGRNIHVFYLLD